MKIVTIIGARPQFIKAAAVSRVIRKRGDLEEVLVHTDQHYDANMSDVFFVELEIPNPDYHLGIGSGNHGWQTGRMLEAIEKVLMKERPDLVLVYGDTNSTLGGALAAAKLQIPVAHVEAGMRSFNRRMPEETNRVLTDHIATLLFSPTSAGVENLSREGILERVYRTGDVMYDVAVLFREQLSKVAADVPLRFGVRSGRYALVTLHREENTDDMERLDSILGGIEKVGQEVAPVLWPAHPRVRATVEKRKHSAIRILDPLPYLEMQSLLMHARICLTDSGGLQKESAFHEIPCVTLRDETEWVELVSAGVNHLAGADEEKIFSLSRVAKWPEGGLPKSLYGDGHSADAIVDIMMNFLVRQRELA
jgi:UDP-N-acetylglucosamine 2-epimerase